MSDSQEETTAEKPESLPAETPAEPVAAAEPAAAEPAAEPVAAVPPPQPPAEEVPYPGPPPEYQRRQYGAFDPRRKSPGLACFLSIFPGLGQIYLGNYPRGFVHMFVVVACGALAGRIGSDVGPVLAFFTFFFWLYQMIDAGRRAALYNRALEGGEELPLPTDLTAGGGGTLGGGILILVIGVLILLYNLDVMYLDWIEDWWPVVPILVGLYLIYKGMRDRKETA